MSALKNLLSLWPNGLAWIERHNAFSGWMPRALGGRRILLRPPRYLLAC